MFTLVGASKKVTSFLLFPIYRSGGDDCYHRDRVSGRSEVDKVGLGPVAEGGQRTVRCLAKQEMAKDRASSMGPVDRPSICLLHGAHKQVGRHSLGNHL